MKLTKKKVFVTALVLCLIATASMGTLAWFSAQDSVKNDFMVATSDADTADEIFSIDVYEYTKNSPNNKVPSGDSFTDILPGDVLKKEPHVANTGYYDQYVRVIVTISDATAWINAVGEDFAIQEMFVGFDGTKWNNISKDIAGSTDTITYVLYYTDKLASGDDITLFTDVKIPTSLTQAQAAAFNADSVPGFSITVKAQAVQTANVGDNAYAAFQTVGMSVDQ